MLSPHKLKWGTCMLQSWVPRFNPDNPSNLAFPTWVTLKDLSLEHHDQALDIAKSLGEVIGWDKANASTKYQRFYIYLKVKEGWVSSIALSAEDIIPTRHVMVDYANLPFRCWACWSWSHLIKNCKDSQKLKHSGTQRTDARCQIHKWGKRKGPMTDQDGFSKQTEDPQEGIFLKWKLRINKGKRFGL